jgi:hypothetical protein
MTVTTDELRELLDNALEIIALTEDRARRLAASVLAEILELRDLGVPEHKINALIGALRECCAYNDELSRTAQALSCRLDQLATGEPGPLTVRSIVRALREPLHVLRYPTEHTASEYVAAVAELREIVEQVPADKLCSDSVRHNLGRVSHDMVVLMTREAVAA